MRIMVRDVGRRRVLRFVAPKPEGGGGGDIENAAVTSGLGLELTSNAESAVYCKDRDGTTGGGSSSSSSSSSRASSAAVGLMEPWDLDPAAAGSGPGSSSGSLQQRGGVVGIGSGDARAPPHPTRCRMRACVVDTDNLVWAYANQMRATLAVVVRTATELLGTNGATGSPPPAPPMRLLMIGGGGGQLALSLFAYFPTLTVHVVELDEEVAMVGRTFFGLWTSSDERLLVFPGQEGRAFMHEARGDYHAVIVDAFNNRNGEVPNGLLTCQFLTEMRRAMVVGGVREGEGGGGGGMPSLVMFNLVSSDTRTIRAALATYAHVFGTAATFVRAVGETGQFLVLALVFGEDVADVESAAMAVLGDLYKEFVGVARWFQQGVGAAGTGGLGDASTLISDPGKSC